MIAAIFHAIFPRATVNASAKFYQSPFITFAFIQPSNRQTNGQTLPHTAVTSVLRPRQ